MAVALVSKIQMIARKMSEALTYVNNLRRAAPISTAPDRSDGLRIAA
jgi:hypothetical protein